MSLFAPDTRYSNSHFAAFASSLTKRVDNIYDASLLSDIQTQARGLPLQPSSTIVAKQDELDKLGTELWNLSTRLRRDEVNPNSKKKEEIALRNSTLCLLRAFAFLLLDSAGGQGAKGRQRKGCIRLMKVALKAARVCIEGNELSTATKILERAAEYQEVLGKEGGRGEDTELANRLRVEYFAVRMSLVSVSTYKLHKSVP